MIDCQESENKYMSICKIPAELNEIKEFSYLEVEVGSSFEEALKRFKSLVQKSKILSKYKERQAYEKPSERKRRKKREAQERNRVALIREKQIASGEWEQRQKYKVQKQQERVKRNAERREHEQHKDEEGE